MGAGLSALWDLISEIDRELNRAGRMSTNESVAKQAREFMINDLNHRVDQARAKGGLALAILGQPVPDGGTTGDCCAVLLGHQTAHIVANTNRRRPHEAPLNLTKCSDDLLGRLWLGAGLLTTKDQSEGADPLMVFGIPFMVPDDKKFIWGPAVRMDFVCRKSFVMGRTAGASSKTKELFQRVADKYDAVSQGTEDFVIETGVRGALDYGPTDRQRLSCLTWCQRLISEGRTWSAAALDALGRLSDPHDSERWREVLTLKSDDVVAGALERAWGKGPPTPQVLLEDMAAWENQTRAAAGEIQQRRHDQTARSRTTSSGPKC